MYTHSYIYSAGIYHTLAESYLSVPHIHTNLYIYTFNYWKPHQVLIHKAYIQYRASTCDIYVLRAGFADQKPRMAGDKYTNTHAYYYKSLVGKQSLCKLGGKLKEFKNHLGWLAARTIPHQIYRELTCGRFGVYCSTLWNDHLEIVFGQSFIKSVDDDDDMTTQFCETQFEYKFLPYFVYIALCFPIRMELLFNIIKEYEELDDFFCISHQHLRCAVRHMWT